METVSHRLRLVPALGVVVAASAAPSATPAETASSTYTGCPAALVHHGRHARFAGGRYVRLKPRSTPLIGHLFGGEEVDGRLAVYAGGENPVRHTSEKVLWIAGLHSHIGPRLRIIGRRMRVLPVGLVPTSDRFRDSFGSAGSDQIPNVLFPSVIDVPRGGCWRLTLRTGRVRGRLYVIALGNEKGR
jgi:hypothetical protein